MNKIDFVLTWVDGSDPQWQESYQQYVGGKKINFAQYRDWGTLKYWFRMVEAYAPWVNQIHFVTCGQTPQWLNTQHPKLNLVSHENYMPQDYLPTFSANPIELNLHRIPGLSEQFVYFNDDTFLTAPVKPEDFFKNGLPCDSSVFACLIPSVKNEVITYILFNDLLHINAHFSKRSCIKKNFGKYFSLKNGKGLLKNLYYAPIGKFGGFENPHLPNSFLKSTYEEVWQAEGEMLDKVCRNRFRTKEDVNQYLMRYWQLAEGNFVPRSPKVGQCLTVGAPKEVFVRYLHKQDVKLLCINDDPSIDNIEEMEKSLLDVFEKTFPQKCSFEV